VNAEKRRRNLHATECVIGNHIENGDWDAGPCKNFTADEHQSAKTIEFLEQQVCDLTSPLFLEKIEEKSK